MIFVPSYDCNGTAAQKWLIRRGATKVQLAGTNFCLDAGSSKSYIQHAWLLPDSDRSSPIAGPANGVGLKIWQCFDNLPAQQWNYSNDNHITLVGTGTDFF